MGIPLPNISEVERHKTEAKRLIELASRMDIRIRDLEDKLLQQDLGTTDSLDSLYDFGDDSQTDDIEAALYVQHQVYLLRTDHKRIMEQIESALQQFHESRAARARWRTGNESDDDSDDDVLGLLSVSTSSPQQPFARVLDVLPGSPAFEVGLRPHDLILQFGETTGYAYQHQVTPLRAIAQANLDRPLEIRILRYYHERRTFYPTPRNGWGGLGALGCYILPM